MKILYGVQATGNGHITRARAMNRALKQRHLDIDYLFSGRAPEQLFDMAPFGNFTCLPGVSFVTEAGRINALDTYKHNDFTGLYRAIKQLDLSAYDLVLTDFEPITAWAAKRQGKPTIAIGHQYAFDHKIPKQGNHLAAALFMKYFTPATVRLGLHWHHFNQPILPPIADIPHTGEPVIENKIIVYLGFEQLDDIIALLTPFHEQQFYIYSAVSAAEDRDHLHLRPLSRERFQQDLATANGVITNAGFELASEAIHLGKKLLVKPLKGQMEQLSNAKALEMLKLGMRMHTLDTQQVDYWLNSFKGQRIVYPDVADAISQWLLDGDWQQTNTLVEQLWQSVQLPAWDASGLGK